MRLSDEEAQAIRMTAAHWFGPDCVIHLFGSRADDRARGGDIDLHIVTTSPERATLANEIGFLVDLEERIGEQKIDLVLTSADATRRPIDRIAQATGVSL